MNVDQARTIAEALHAIKPSTDSESRFSDREWTAIVEAAQDAIEQYSANVDANAFRRMCQFGRRRTRD